MSIYDPAEEHAKIHLLQARISELEAGIEIGNKLLAGRDKQIAELKAEVEEWKAACADEAKKHSEAITRAQNAEAKLKEWANKESLPDCEACAALAAAKEEK